MATNVTKRLDPVTITRDLVKLPSYEQEAGVGEYIFNYLQQFSYLTVTKQVIAPGRFNVIARTAGEPKLLLAGHMDTVVPKEGWTHDQFKGAIEGSRLYGLGTYDMKGGIAAVLSALNQIPEPSGLTLLFYCDEEFGFSGMKTFIKQEKPPYPKLVLTAEPSNLQIWNTHRGLIELHLALKGITGHAANPAAGVNAITGLQLVLSQLHDWLKAARTPSLGSSSLNVAYLRGGLKRGEDQGEVVLGKDGNNIADYAEAILDIRPTKPELRAGAVVSRLEKLIAAAGLELLKVEVRHDLGALYTDPQELTAIEAITGATYLNAATKGYGDGQLIQEAWGVPVANLGPKGANPHAVDEWVDIASLKTLMDMYTRIIQHYCQA